MQIPQRAIPASAAVTADDKFVQGIVNLDVYSVYTKNPESLLLKTSASCSSLASLASLNTSSQQQQPSHQQAVAIEPPSSATSTSSNTSTATASPLISSGIIDMSQFKNTKGAPSVIWKKGGMLTISPNEADYDQLTLEELKIASVLRVLPTQYLHIKETILTQVYLRGPFKKRDAKSWFRIDVNKTAILFDWFKALGWIPNTDEWK